ncbi:MAG: PTS sugar transporter subunit IIB [Spirochaetales bacterium]|jgi:PTS system galactitol-specific IIB component|nr:PTS sugar transporter subunit IIB [Spirochaetales bacterium]
MKTILLACGTGIVTSTAVRAKLSKALDERGYEGKYKIVQCKIAEVPAASANANLCVATTQVSGETKCPVILGVCFLTGINTAPVLEQITKLLDE